MGRRVRDARLGSAASPMVDFYETMPPSAKKRFGKIAEVAGLGNSLEESMEKLKAAMVTKWLAFIAASIKAQPPQPDEVLEYEAGNRLFLRATFGEETTDLVLHFCKNRSITPQTMVEHMEGGFESWPPEYLVRELRSADRALEKEAMRKITKPRAGKVDEPDS